MHAMRLLGEQLPPGAEIARSCSTGYGETLLKSAFLLDEGEVETIAHYARPPPSSTRTSTAFWTSAGRT